MATITLNALGTSWHIELFETLTTATHTALTEHCVFLLRDIEDRFSRFVPTSLVSRLNNERRLATTDPDLYHLIQTGKRLYLQTEGLFNILNGDIVTARGYDAAYSFIPEDRSGEQGNPHTDISCSDTDITLTKGQLDLGGFGKGWAIDRVAQALHTAGHQHFLINGGGDIYGTSEGGQPINLYLEHPTRPKVYFGQTTILHQGFAASSPYKRAWRHGDTTHHHIVADHALTADASFIIATDAMTADAAATVALMTNDANHERIMRTLGVASATFHSQQEQLRYTATFPFFPFTNQATVTTS